MNYYSISEEQTSIGDHSESLSEWDGNSGCSFPGDASPDMILEPRVLLDAALFDSDAESDTADTVDKEGAYTSLSPADTKEDTTDTASPTSQSRHRQTPRIFTFALPKQVQATIAATLQEDVSLGYIASLVDGSPLPSWLVFDPQTQTFVGAPPNDNICGLQIRLTITSSRKGKLLSFVFVDFTIFVAETSDVGTLLLTGKASLGEELHVTISDPEGVTSGKAHYSWRVFRDGAWVPIPGANGRTYALQQSDVGYPVRVFVTYANAEGEKKTVVSEPAEVRFQVSSHTPPTRIWTSQAKEGSEYVYKLSDENIFVCHFGSLESIDSTKIRATLFDGRPLPRWLSFDPQTLEFQGTPGNDDVGQPMIRVTAVTEDGETRFAEFRIHVKNTDNPGKIEMLGRAIPGQLLYAYVSDLDGIRTKALSENLQTMESISYYWEMKRPDLQSAESCCVEKWRPMENHGPNYLLQVSDIGRRIRVRVVYQDLRKTLCCGNEKGHVHLHSDSIRIAPLHAGSTAPCIRKGSEGTHGGFSSYRAQVRREYGFLSRQPFVARPGSSISDYTASLYDGRTLPSWLMFKVLERNGSVQPDDPLQADEKATEDFLRLAGTPKKEDIGDWMIRLRATSSEGEASDMYIRIHVTGDSTQDSLALRVLQGPDVERPLLHAEISASGGVREGSVRYTWKGEKSGEVTTLRTTHVPFFPIEQASRFDRIEVLVQYADAHTLKTRSVSHKIDIQEALHAVPTVVRSLKSRSVKEGETFVYRIPADTFAVPSIWGVHYHASLSDGRGLPSWLSFDSPSRTFRGRPDIADLGALEVRVTATVNEGGASYVDFLLFVEKVDRKGEALVIGEAFVGETLHAHVKDPDGIIAGSIAYSWETKSAKGWLPIRGAHARSHTLQVGDAECRVRLVATYIDATDGKRRVVASGATQIVASDPAHAHS